MADHPNADTLRKGYEAFQTGDMDSLRNQYFSPDVVWHVGGRSKYAGDHAGVDNVLKLFMENFQDTNGTLKVELHDVVANDEHVMAMGTFSGSRNGKQLSDRFAHMAHVKDGKMTESWIFAENQDKVDDFWA